MVEQFAIKVYTYVLSFGFFVSYLVLEVVAELDLFLGGIPDGA